MSSFTGFFFDYDDLFSSLPKPLIATILLILLFIFARYLDLVSETHLTKTLTSIAHHYSIGENFAGKFLLALANSSPDLFTSIISTSKAENIENSDLGTNSLLSGVIFVLNIVLGSIFLYSERYIDFKKPCILISEIFLISKVYLAIFVVYFWFLQEGEKDDLDRSGSFLETEEEELLIDNNSYDSFDDMEAIDSETQPILSSYTEYDFSFLQKALNLFDFPFSFFTSISIPILNKNNTKLKYSLFLNMIILLQNISFFRVEKKTISLMLSISILAKKLLQ
eukprot:snap_masked-scaffold_12-processed-gene-3.39-mRNA-1 protein AED:1.00 eAED:1.00 QI:0/0/0/0/1/1/3/0/280